MNGKMRKLFWKIKSTRTDAEGLENSASVLLTLFNMEVKPR